MASSSAFDGALRAVAKTVPTDAVGADLSCLTSSRPRPREQPVMRYEAMVKAESIWSFKEFRCEGCYRIRAVADMVRSP